MAKISAYGDEKLREWKHPNGTRIVLTRKGRLLRNYLKGDGLVQVAKGHTGDRVAKVERYAEVRGYTEVTK